ncbi:MAG: hypothetical protein IPL08_01205 [Saprospiraceae bacterium]|jgi:hypothetical protein|nr:hypothetical protein [Saprospiraceae bacterium]
MGHHHLQLYKIPETDDNLLDISGKGLKKLLIITHKNDYGEAEKMTLQKMMAAIKYDFENDLQLLVLDPEFPISLGNSSINFKDLISFGVSAPLLGFNMEHQMNQVLHFDQARVLFTESIKIINAAPPKKQLLWNLLQDMFLK